MDPARLDEPLPTPEDDASGLLTPPAFAWQPRQKFQDRVWLHVILFVLTIAATTSVGVYYYLSFVSEFSISDPVGLPIPVAQLFIRGFWYSGTLIAILGCHELGHYLACRYYDVDASLPFFLPFVVIPGTLGAFIRIREPIPTKRMLFDIGIAGPIAGFVIAVPALIIGIAMSHVVPLPPNLVGQEYGEPLLFKLISWVFWGTIPDGYTLNMHPMGFAAWWGLLVTALNLFPAGQLDGGHISYSVFGSRSTYVTFATVLVAIALSFLASSWIVWTSLMVVMLYLFGPNHPKVFDEHVPLDRARLILALVALGMLIVSFTPVPLETIQQLRR